MFFGRAQKHSEQAWAEDIAAADGICPSPQSDRAISRCRCHGDIVFEFKVDFPYPARRT
ncbi:hypothetical protein [Hyphomicrobium sp.]|jgi:hypothetical protein|uniref:hypothetical protein n=1 Tax=Hyphomicrobium sp. TaxID=82 RepID=UPI00356486DB